MQVFSFVKDLDMFGAPVPNLFNMGGHKKVKTWLGALISIMIVSLIVAFSLIKIERLVQRKNPEISTNTEVLDFTEKFDTSSDDFMMAFATKSMDIEPRHARWLAEARYSIDGRSDVKRRWDLHKCSEDEMKLFYEPENEITASDMKKYQQAGQLYCLDWKAIGYELYGDRRNGKQFADIQVNLYACGT